jgi:type I restriction enzyme S subunit
LKDDTQATEYGEIPADWQVKQLRDICVPDSGVQTGPFGSQLHQRDYQAFGTPIITVEHLGENRIVHQDLPLVSYADRQRLSRYDMRMGDIIFSRVGSVDRRSLVREEDGWLFSGRCLRVRPNSEIVSPEYLSWFFGLPAFKEHIRAIAVGATMPSINTDILSCVQVILPPLAEQRAIARILGALDDKIELNRRMNRTLESVAQALFKSWFVDFDPVTAKVEGRTPFGMSAETAALFPEEFVESELGAIPKGWRYVPMGEVIVNFDSRRIPLSGAQRLQRQGIYPYYGAASVMDYVDDYLFDGIYLLIGEDGSVTDKDGMAVTQYIWGKFWVNNHAHVLQGKNGICTEQILMHYKFEPLLPYVTGAVQPKLNQGNMNSMPFLMPNREVAEVYSKTVTPWFALIRANIDEIITLASIRDALLPRLLSGEVRVKA